MVELDAQPQPSLVDVAVALPVSGAFTYGVPAELTGALQIGSRVAVPFGARRVTGYVVALDAALAEGAPAPRDIADVLDERPAFDADSLALFRWVARYYHAPLGEVVRTALPSSMTAASTRRVTLTPLGHGAAGMPGADPLLVTLARTAGGDAELRFLLREGRGTMTRLWRLERDGYVSLRHVEQRPEQGQRTERVAVFVMQVPLPGNAPRAREVLAAVARAGEVPVARLRDELGDVAGPLRSLESRGAVRLEERRVFRTPQGTFLDSGELAAVDPPPLTPEQSKAVHAVLAGLGAGYHAYLLHGVTGSGKTEVYLHLIAAAVARGLGAIVLVPEIALTPQLVGRFRARFGDRVAVLHSGLSDGERLDQWEQTRRGDLPIVVGARSAIFAPVQPLGLVVVDEEHETSFKQEDQLRYHARDLALVRGQLAGASVVLGSATPSIESVYNARHGKLTLLRMAERVNARPLPEVRLIDLRRTEFADQERVLSQPLLDAVRANLAAGEQTLLFLNRRGYASFLLCRSCGHLAECPHCSISLTYHHAQRRLVCHYCDHHRAAPTQCPKCAGTLIQPMGVGTEKVEEILRTLLPGARLARMDRDTTRGAALGALLRAVRAREIDVLVGTQMIAKGHDFPGVTLVGVLLADQGLKFPDFRAAERTFQLLTQVAGRAGRGDRPGRVLVQSYDPGHYSLRHARDADFAAFIEDELALRQERRYPPFTHLALVRVVANEAADAAREAERAAQILLAADHKKAIGLLGPTPAPIERIKGRYRWHLLARSSSRTALHEALAELGTWLERHRGATTTVTIDVDPVNML